MKYLAILLLCVSCTVTNYDCVPQYPVSEPQKRLEMNHEEAQAMIRLVIKERDEKWQNINHQQ